MLPPIGSDRKPLCLDRKSTRLNSSHSSISYAVFCLKKKTEQGEIVGFLGPNGAGKTTTMRILTGYIPPTDGTATVAGYDVVEESLEVRKRLGYFPETVPLYDDMTAIDYLKFMADLRRIPNP